MWVGESVWVGAVWGGSRCVGVALWVGNLSASEWSVSLEGCFHCSSGTSWQAYRPLCPWRLAACMRGSTGYRYATPVTERALLVRPGLHPTDERSISQYWLPNGVHPIIVETPSPRLVPRKPLTSNGSGQHHGAPNGTDCTRHVTPTSYSSPTGPTAMTGRLPARWSPQ